MTAGDAQAPGTSHSGKVRDLYELADGRLLMVACDRISAYDFVLEPDDPRQGRDPHPDVAVVVRPARATSCRTTCCRPTSRAGRAGPCRDLRAARRCSRSSASRAATSPARAGRLPGDRGGLRRRAARRVSSTARGSRADLHAGDQGRARRARRERDVRGGRRDRRGRSRGQASRDLTLEVYGRAEEIARERGHHPGRHQVRVRPARRRHASSSPTRC